MTRLMQLEATICEIAIVIQMHGYKWGGKSINMTSFGVLNSSSHIKIHSEESYKYIFLVNDATKFASSIENGFELDGILHSVDWAAMHGNIKAKQWPLWRPKTAWVLLWGHGGGGGGGGRTRPSEKTVFGSGAGRLSANPSSTYVIETPFLTWRALLALLSASRKEPRDGEASVTSPLSWVLAHSENQVLVLRFLFALGFSCCLLLRSDLFDRSRMLVMPMRLPRVLLRSWKKDPVDCTERHVERCVAVHCSILYNISRELKGEGRLNEMNRHINLDNHVE